MLKGAYTSQEMAAQLGITRQAVDQRAKAEGWDSRPRKGRGGGREWLVNDKMPETTRTALAKAIAQKTEHLPAPLSTCTAADIVVPDYAWNRGKARYRILAEWKNQIAQARAKGIPTSAATETFLTTLKTGLLLPPNILEAAGAVSQPTLYRWDKVLREQGGDLEALADKRGGWLRGQPKGAGRISEEAEQAFLGVYLKPNQPSLQYAYGCMEMALKRQNLAVPSYSSVRRFFQRFDAIHHDLVVWMREGEKAYADKVGAFLSRDDSILEVGDVLVADGHKLNFLVINPETGKPCRMTLIGWEDWASRMFVGFEVMLNENTQAISVSLFRSIINLGKLPKAAYIDNGKAFKNEFFDGKDVDLEEFDGLYARLGIYVQHSAPYVARTKVIERWWGDFDRQCEVSLASYTGASIEGKPAHMNRNENWHKKQHAKTAHIPTVAEVVRLVTEFARWKAHQPHPTRPDTTPYEMFMAGRGPGFPVEEAEKLSRQFLHRKGIHPRRCRFTLYGVEFESETLHGLNKELVAHYSYTDLTCVYVYDEGRLLCTARPVTTVNPLASLLGDELDVATVKAAQKQVANLRRDTRKQATALAAWGASTEALTALPWMLPATERKTPLTLIEGGKVSVSETATPALPAVSVLSEAEAAELHALSERLQAERVAAPAYEKPAYFASERERYEFLFDLAVVGKTPLAHEDTAFMAAFERSPAYAASARRYSELREFFAQQPQEAIG